MSEGRFESWHKMVASIGVIGTLYLGSIGYRHTVEKDAKPEPPTTIQVTAPQPSERSEDIRNINQFRWRLQSAFNSAISVGDFDAVMNLFIDSKNPTPKAKELTSKLGTLWPQFMASRNAQITMRITEWKIVNLADDDADIDIAFNISGTEMGRPETQSGKQRVHMTKYEGEWLLAGAR